jgi:archaellum biogenesis protein FlaJ (TadC family)
VDPSHDDLHPQTPDTFALRRRVLLTGVLSLVLYVAVVVLLDALGAPSLYALLAVGLIYAAVVRPLMRPVREAVRLRRRLAFQAWADAREAGALDDDGQAPHG